MKGFSPIRVGFQFFQFFKKFIIFCMISQEKLYLFILHFINGLYVNLSHLKPGIP